MKTLEKKIVSLIKIVLIPLGALVAPMSAFAAPVLVSSGGGIPAPITTVKGLLNFMCIIFDWMFYGLIALSIIMVVVAGFNYVTANGEAEKVSKANKMILYSAIGIAVALLAKGIPLIVASFFSISSGIQSC